MAQYKFQGVIDNISEPQLEFINRIIAENGYENSKVTFENVGEVGDNYVANVKRIIIEEENGNLQLIAKIASTNDTMRLITQTTIMFKNEHIMYTEILPKLVQLQKDAGIPESEHLKYPKCYGSQTEVPHEVILLEDLKSSQFVMLKKLESFPNDCVKSVLKNFAVFHSLSYVLKHKEPNTYNNFKENLVDIFQIVAGTEMMKTNFQAVEDHTLSILQNPEHIKCFKNKVLDTIPLSAKLAKADSNSKYTVIQQGDSWANNIMFRFEDGKLIDSIMIDYQQSKNNNPVTDVMYMIFNCTDYETRRQNFYDWIDYYHSELDKSLSNFNLKANYIYPRDKLDVDLKRYGKLMFGMSVLIANITRFANATVKKSEETETDNLSENSVSEDKDIMLFRNKIVGLLNSFTEFGLL